MYYTQHTLEEWKVIRITFLKDQAYAQITNLYPEYKQLNLHKWSDFGYIEQEYLDMVAYINNIRTEVNIIETQINIQTTILGVLDIDVDIT